MRKNKPLLVIAAVAMMLIAASSAYAYGEAWTGWFNAGTLYYGGNPYTGSGSGGTIGDTTNDANTLDLFHPITVPANVPFVYSAGNDTIYFTLSTFIGSKPTGETGNKVGSGFWTGTARVASTSTTHNIGGSWTSCLPDNFNYTVSPPRYTATWLVTGSNPTGITGNGSSSGTRTNRW